MIKALTLGAMLGAAFAGLASAQEVREDPLYKPGNSSIIGVNHVGLSVKDLDAASAFYTGAFGLETIGARQSLSPALQSAAESSATPASVQQLKGPNSFLKLMAFEGNKQADDNSLQPQGPGITHLCFTASKTRPLDGKAVDAGASWVSTSKAMVDMRGVGYMYGYLRDPDGVMFEIEHNPDPELDIELWMGHVALATNDLTATLAFYGRLLGFEAYRRVDNISGPTFDQVGGLDGGVLHGAWFRLAPFYNLEFWEYVNPRTEPAGNPVALNEIGYNLIALESKDIEADAARLTAAGIETLTGIVAVEDGQAIFLRDPDGNLLSITEFEDGSALSLNALPMFERRQ